MALHILIGRIDESFRFIYNHETDNLVLTFSQKNDTNLQRMMLLIIVMFRWESFQKQLREMLHHSDVKGSELKKPTASLFTYPMPDCMCKQATTKNSTKLRR